MKTELYNPTGKTEILEDLEKSYSKWSSSNKSPSGVVEDRIRGSNYIQHLQGVFVGKETKTQLEEMWSRIFLNENITEPAI